MASESVSVQELCSLVTSGGTPKRSIPEYYTPGSVAWVKTGDLRDGPVQHVDERISELGLRESAAKLLPERSVLMAMYGATVGAMGWLPEAMACNQAACAMIARADICDWRWLFYALLDKRPELIGLANGAAQQNLNVGTIARFRLSTPPLPTQRAIAEVLGALDDKIAANSKVVESASALCVGLGRVLAESSSRVRLHEVAASRKDQVTPQAMAEVAHFSLPAFDAGQLAADDNGTSILSAKLRISRPSVLLSRLNPRFPRIWEVPTLPPKEAVASTEFMVLEPLGVSTSTLWAVLSQTMVSERLQELARGTSGSHQRVRPDDVMSTEIADPREFTAAQARSLDAISERRHASITESLHLATLRDTLLPHLMSGRITVREAEKTLSEAL